MDCVEGRRGLAYTNYRDAQEEHRWQVEFIRPKVVFIENALLERYFDMLRGQGRDALFAWTRLLPRARACCTSGTCWTACRMRTPASRDDMREDALVHRFTGGTTGKSKCAAYTMDNWMAMRDSMYMESEQV
ncbi:hypothetical protein ACU4HD_10445 [Cupriavidus basilensis]